MVRLPLFGGTIGLVMFARSALLTPLGLKAVEASGLWLTR